MAKLQKIDTFNFGKRS